MEHYEIAAYGTVRAFAELLGESNHVPLIEQTLEAEKQADQKLTQLAEQLNWQAEVDETDATSRQRESKSASKQAA